MAQNSAHKMTQGEVNSIKNEALGSGFLRIIRKLFFTLPDYMLGLTSPTDDSLTALLFDTENTYFIYITKHMGICLYMFCIE